MRLQIDEGSKNDIIRAVIRAPVNDLTQGPQNSFLFMLDSVFKPQFTHFFNTFSSSCYNNSYSSSHP